MFAIVVTLLSLIASNQAFAATCSLSCPVDETCYATDAEALDCILSVPFNEEWANATIDVLSQSLENFGFGPLYHSTGPPYTIELDVMGELATAGAKAVNGDFATDLDFQEYVQSILQRTIDAHTRYQKPKCYTATFVQPFAFDMRVEVSGKTDPSDVASEPVVYLMRNIYTEEYQALYPDVDIEGSLIGRKVTLLDGLEVTTAVSAWGDTHETRSNNRGSRFNAAIRSYLYRSAISVNVLPVTDLQVTLDDGNTFTLPWMAAYTAGLANVTLCAAEEEDNAVVSQQTLPKQGRKARGLSPTKAAAADPHQLDLTTPAPPLVSAAILSEERADREMIIAPEDSQYEISCFTQITSGTEGASEASVSRVLVMKVASFSPEGEYQVAWAGFLAEAQTCLSTEFDMIVVDVMQNGGGYVCLGLRLLELLVEEYEDDHTKVQMQYDLPHSPLMDAYIATVDAPDPYPDPAMVEQILNPETQESYPDGKSYYYPGRNVTQGGVVNWRTNFFALDCREAEAMPADGYRPAKFMPPERLVILTDGTCGSTCASFADIALEHKKATFIGAGGLWNEPMDVSSFAGGFVCQPAYLQNIAEWSGLTFPKFLTNQRWQFGWAAWYSAKLPSRPAQFTRQEATLREAFWGFPHPSINATETTAMVSSLYDSVIAASITRLAAVADATTSSDSSTCGDRFTTTTGNSLVALCSILGAAVLLMAGYVYLSSSPKEGKYGRLSADHAEDDPLQKSMLA